MRSPDARHVTGLLARLDAIDLREMQRRLEDALARAAAGTTSRDGYGSSRSMAGGGRGGGDGTSLTEAAALDALTMELRDPVKYQALQAVQAVVDAVEALARCESALTMVEKLGGLVPIESTLCEPCAWAGLDQPPTYFGDAGGSLHHAMRLCADHRDFVQRFGEMPSIEQTRRHDRTGVWMVAEPVAST